MYYLRYGKISFRDLDIVWFICAFMLLLSCTTIILSAVHFLPYDALWVGAYLFIITLLFFFSIFKRVKEKFSIDNGVLSIIGIGTKKDICLPPKVSIIISYADLMPPLATRSIHSLHMKQIIPLKDRYSAVLLEGEIDEDSLTVVQQKNYSASNVEEAFPARFIYSFVCNQYLLNKLFDQVSCKIIIPSSLENKISIEDYSQVTFVDQSY